MAERQYCECQCLWQVPLCEQKLGPANQDLQYYYFYVMATLKVDMPILTLIFVTFNWLTLTSEMHFVKFHPEVASCLLSRGKRKYAPLRMRLLWKYIRNHFLVLPFNFTFFVTSPKLPKIWSWNFGFANRKIWAFIWYQKMYYFLLSPGGWECDRHIKVL